MERPWTGFGMAGGIQVSWLRTGRLQPLVLGLLLVFGGCYGLSAAWSQEAGSDVLHLKNGGQRRGRVIAQTDTEIMLEVQGGEVLPVDRSQVVRIERNAALVGKEAKPVQGEGGAVPLPVVPEGPPAQAGGAAKEEEREVQELFRELKGLGSDLRGEREAALKRALDLGFRCVPVLLAFFQPGQKLSPELRMGAVRALAQLGPLEKMAADTLGWVAMKDPDREVRREAAEAIRQLKDDRALQYVLKFSTSETPAHQLASARALREINDDRAFAALAVAIPAPQVNGNMPDEGAEVREIPNMPMGGMLRGPLYLPNRQVMGTAENLMSKPAETLEAIAGKRLGGLGQVWVNWLNEKVGTWTQREREEAYRRSRSLMGRMGSPQAKGD